MVPHLWRHRLSVSCSGFESAFSDSVLIDDGTKLRAYRYHNKLLETDLADFQLPPLPPSRAFSKKPGIVIHNSKGGGLLPACFS